MIDLTDTGQEKAKVSLDPSVRRQGHHHSGDQVAQKRFRPSDTDTVTSTAREATASSSGKREC